MYPRYAREERIADGVMHALGVTAALSGALFLIIWSAMRLSGSEIVALTIYGTALMATFVASACYHLSPKEAWRPLLRRIDHAAIYLKIAGTFTPFAVLLSTAFGYAVLALVWALAVFGIIRKLFFWQTPGPWGPALPLIMGWMGSAMIWNAAQTLHPASIALIVAGGLAYTIGVVFFAWEGLKYTMAIWHAHVLAGSGCLFAAVTVAAVTTL